MELHFETAEDARKLLNAVQDILVKYRKIYVSDVYDLAGLPTKLEDHKIGWKSFDEVCIVDINDKHFIRFPATTQLER